MKKCICEICTCGRHRCPHRPVSSIRKAASLGACAISEYRQTFTKFVAKPRESFKPAYKPIERTGKLDAHTTHRNDYVVHPLQPKTIVGPSVAYEKPTKTMETTTEYAREYEEKPLQVPESSPKKPELHVTKPDVAPFDATTTQRVDFRAWTNATPAQSYKTTRVYAPPREKFNATSTFQADFLVNGGVVPRESCRPNRIAFKSDAPFDATTTNRVDYRPFSTGSPVRPRPKSRMIVARQKFDSTTTNRVDYVAHTGIERPKCVKPVMEMTTSQTRAPFDGQTIHSVSYVPWKASTQSGYGPKFDYVPPKQKFDHMTTTQVEYVAHELAKRSPKVIERASDGPSAPFMGTTTHRSDFLAWQAKPRERMRQDFVYKPPDVPFAAQSTFQAHFQGKGAEQPTISAKPVASRASYDGAPFEGTTMYRDAFTKKDVGPCPAASLRERYTPPVHDPFVYSHQAASGHKFFMPLNAYEKTQQRLSKSMPEMGSVCV